jgi:hypothetical protein
MRKKWKENKTIIKALFLKWASVLNPYHATNNNTFTAPGGIN